MNDFILRPPLSASIAVGWPWVVLAILFSVAALIGHQSLWMVAGMCLIVFAILSSWASSHRLKIEDGLLCYESLFRSTISIDIRDIATIQPRVGTEKYADRFLPTIRLEVVPTKESGVSPFSINRKMFRMADIDRLIETLGK